MLLSINYKLRVFIFKGKNKFGVRTEKSFPLHSVFTVQSQLDLVTGQSLNLSSLDMNVLQCRQHKLGLKDNITLM